MARLAFIIPILFAVAGPACAQEAATGTAAPAASTRCGGLLCDLYYAGKPAPSAAQAVTASTGGAAPAVAQTETFAPLGTSLPCRDFICGMFGGRTPEAPAPATQAAAAEPGPAEPAKGEAVTSKTKRHRTAARRTPASAEPR